jgi:hypothetical protein
MRIIHPARHHSVSLHYGEDGKCIFFIKICTTLCLNLVNISAKMPQRPPKGRKLSRISRLREPWGEIGGLAQIQTRLFLKTDIDSLWRTGCCFFRGRLVPEGQCNSAVSLRVCNMSGFFDGSHDSKKKVEKFPPDATTNLVLDFALCNTI